MEVEVDYSKQRLSVDPDYRTQVGKEGEGKEEEGDAPLLVPSV